MFEPMLSGIVEVPDDNETQGAIAAGWLEPIVTLTPEELRYRTREAEQQPRTGLSADCKLAPEITLAILMGGREHPCDGCNMDRAKCRGYPRKERQPGLTGSTV